MHKKDNPRSDSPFTEGLLSGTRALVAGTLCSRVLGFIRDMLFAALLGPGADLFLPAFRIANVFRRLLAEGSLGLSYGVAIAPVLAHYGSQEALRFARHALWAVFWRASAVTVLLGLAAWPILLLLTPGLNADHMERAVVYVRWCLAYVPLSLACAIVFAHSAVLGDFWPQTSGPALFNLALILWVGLVFWNTAGISSAPEPPRWGYTDPQTLLCVGVIVAGLAQTVWAIFCLKKGSALKIAPEKRDTPAMNDAESAPSVKMRAATFAAHLPRSLFGAAPHQLQALVGMALASFISEGGIAALYFAERLIELPLGLIGVTVGLASLPGLSSLALQKRYVAFTEALERGIGLTAFISIPAAAGLVVLAHPLTSMLFGYGAFGQHAVELTSSVLQGYAFGLPALCASRPLLAGVYSLRDTSTPIIAALYSVALLIGVFGLGVFTGTERTPGLILGLGLSAGAWCNFWLLLRALRSQSLAPGPALWGRIALYGIAAFILGALLTCLPTQPLALFGGITLSGITWVGVFYAIGNRDARNLLGCFLWRKRPDS